MKKRANDKIISSDSVIPLYTKNEAICRARPGVTFYVFFFSALGLVLDASLALPDVVLLAYLVCFICRKSPNDAYCDFTFHVYLKMNCFTVFANF